MIVGSRAILSVLFAAIFLAAACAPPVLAVQPDEVLSDANLEKRARSLSTGLRCLVCQNQSIDDSDAPLARDLRVLVRERLVAGDSDQQVIDYVVARYGDFVLLKPPMNTHTLLLWIAPLLALAGAIVVILRGMRAQPAAPVAIAAPLSAREEEELDRLIKSTRGPDTPAG
jgi:cytochrome c-type biogenesis protein CcmH